MEAPDSRRIMRSSLIFRALEEIGTQEIQVLQGTTIDKGKVKVKLKEVREILHREYLKDTKDHIVIDISLLKSLRTEYIDLSKLKQGTLVKRKVKLHDGTYSIPFEMTVEEALELIDQEIKVIKADDDIAFQSYYAIYGLIEKISLKLTQLNLDSVLDLDILLDDFFSGKIKFVGK